MAASSLQQGNRTTTAHLTAAEYSMRQTLTMLPQGNSKLPWQNAGGSSEVKAEQHLRGPLRRCPHCDVSQLYIPARDVTAPEDPPLMSAPNVPRAGAEPATDSIAAGALQRANNALVILQQTALHNVPWLAADDSGDWTPKLVMLPVDEQVLQALDTHWNTSISGAWTRRRCYTADRCNACAHDDSACTAMAEVCRACPWTLRLLGLLQVHQRQGRRARDACA